MLIPIIGLCIIWIGLLIPVIQERRAWIVYAHTGSGLFFTSLLLNLCLHQTGDLADIIWLKITGFALFIPAVILFISSIIAIAHEAGSRLEFFYGIFKKAGNRLIIQYILKQIIPGVTHGEKSIQ